jgi:hypothetical protein
MLGEQLAFCFCCCLRGWHVDGQWIECAGGSSSSSSSSSTLLVPGSEYIGHSNGDRGKRLVARAVHAWDLGLL